MDRHTDTHTYIHTDMCTYIQTDRHIYKENINFDCTWTDIQTHIHTYRHTDIQTCVHTYRDTDIYTKKI